MGEKEENQCENVITNSGTIFNLMALSSPDRQFTANVPPYKGDLSWKYCKVAAGGAYARYSNSFGRDDLIATQPIGVQKADDIRDGNIITGEIVGISFV